MKTIIKITGDIQVIDYASESLLKEEDFNSVYYMIFHWEKLDSLTVNDSEENLIKKKGKYEKTKEYLHKLFNEDGEHPLPVVCHTRTYYNQEITYTIEHEDEFDIKKLQLVKSDYECQEYPYLIIGEYILYDGKKFKVEDAAYDYCPEEKMYNEFTISEFED